MDYLILFCATVLAVVSVELFRRRITETAIDVLSAFTGAFVLGILVFHMLPEVYSGGLSPLRTGLCIMTGLLIQTGLDFFTRGVDHGHAHTPHSGHTDQGALTLGMFISLALHTFLESTPILAGEHHGHTHTHASLQTEGLSPLLISIALHTIPMAIVLYLLILRRVHSRIKAWGAMTLFALAGPLGILAGARLEFIHHYYSAALAVVIGILLHVSSVMLFDCETALYGKTRKLAVIVLGFAAAAAVAL